MIRQKKKLFIQPGRWPTGALLVVGMVSLIASCSPRTSHWSPVESPKELKVSWAEFHHPVGFADTSATLGQSQKSTLDRFLSRVGRGSGVKVTITAAALDDAALVQKREKALASYLRRRGFEVALAHPQNTAPSQANNVRVTVGRHLVKTPSCPDWSKAATGDPSNRVTSNFGCATATNFGRMIADPGVLVHGTDEFGPGDGEALAVGVRRYQADKIRKPGKTSTLKIGGGN